MHRPEWNAKFEKGGREGRKVPVGKSFSWGSCTVTVPAVYVCEEGLILDLCMEADREEFRRFLEKWRYLFDMEQNGGKIPAGELRRFEAENPLDQQFRTELSVGGKYLRYRSGTGMQWVPDDLIPIMRDSTDIQPFMRHYRLDPDRVWLFRRETFFWGEAGQQPLEDLQIKLSQQPRIFYGQAFPMPAVGETVAIQNPLTGREHILRVLDVSAEQIRHFRQEGVQFPEHCVVMQYSLLPELTKEEFFVSDTEESDPPRRAGGAGVSGGAIGVIARDREKPEGRYTVSSLHFVPVEKLVWQPGFREKTGEDIQVTLI